MRYYLDTEFNGFGGELISLALVPASRDLAPFYAVTQWRQPTVPWVAEHVVPYLGMAARPRGDVTEDLTGYLRRAAQRYGIIIVADWPTDFEHLLALLITAPGEMAPAPDFDMEFRRMAGFNTAARSRMPHNALADAEALRDYWEERRNAKV